MHRKTNRRNITVTLMDGSIDGRYEYRLDSWNIDVYKIPHELLKESDTIKGLHTPGVYFLFGKESCTDAQFVYVGEAEDIYKRLNQKHTFERGEYSEKWDDAIIFVALSDGDLDKAKIKYLEARFYELASEALRYVVKNGNKPKKSMLAQQNLDSMEQLIEHAKLILPTTGYDIFTAKPKLSESPKNPAQQKPKKKQTKKMKRGNIPELPDLSLKVGPFVRTAMTNLSNSNFSFSEEQLLEMQTREWGNKVLKLYPKHPFLKLFDPTNPKGHVVDGYTRYYSEPLIFSGRKYYLTKELFSKTKEPFIQWYKSLSKD